MSKSDEKMLKIICKQGGTLNPTYDVKPQAPNHSLTEIVVHLCAASCFENEIFVVSISCFHQNLQQKVY